jgi:hypothetical protein
VTWRVWAATFLFLAVAAGIVGVIHWYAYSTYYLGNNNGVLAVFRGQPSGVLWYKPEVVVETNYPVADLRPSDRRAVDATISEPTKKEAITHAKNLYKAWEQTQGTLGTTTTTTSTTTTTTPG